MSKDNIDFNTWCTMNGFKFPSRPGFSANPFEFLQKELRGMQKTPVNVSKRRKEFVELVIYGINDLQNRDYVKATVKIGAIIDCAIKIPHDELGMNAIIFNGFRMLLCYCFTKSQVHCGTRIVKNWIPEFNTIFNFKFIRYLEIAQNLKSENYQYTISCINRLKENPDATTMLHISFNGIDLFDEEIIPEVNAGILNKNIEIIGIYCLLSLEEKGASANKPASNNKLIAFLEELLNVLSEGLQSNASEFSLRYKDKLQVLKSLFLLPKNKELFRNILSSPNMFETILKLVKENSVSNETKKEPILEESKSSKKKKRKNRQKNKSTSEGESEPQCDTEKGNKSNTEETDESVQSDSKSEDKKVGNKAEKNATKNENKPEKNATKNEKKAEKNATKNEKKAEKNATKNENKADGAKKSNNASDDFKKFFSSSMKKRFEELSETFTDIQNNFASDVNDTMKNNNAMLHALMYEMQNVQTNLTGLEEEKRTAIETLKAENSKLSDDMKELTQAHKISLKTIKEKDHLINTLQNQYKEAERQLNYERTKNFKATTKCSQYLDEKFHFLDYYYKDLIRRQTIEKDFLCDIADNATNKIDPNVMKEEISKKTQLIEKLKAKHENIVRNRGINTHLKCVFNEEVQDDLQFLSHVKKAILNDTKSTAADMEGAKSLALLNNNAPSTSFQNELSKEKSIQEFLTENIKSATPDEIADALVKLSQEKKGQIFDMPKKQILDEVRNILESETSCIICLDDLSNNKINRLQCGHVFHKKCILNWFRKNNGKSCPICRKSDN